MLPATPKSSSRETCNKSDGFAVSLAVYGSSAPIYTQPVKTSRPKTPKEPKKQTRRKYPFPVEKIILLAERLELTSLRERQQIESISYIKTGSEECEETASGLDFSLDLSSVNADSEEEEEEEEGSGSETTETVHYNSRSSTTRREDGGDLVNLYVSSVENQELTKYLRPCRGCSEPRCVCPEEERTKRDKGVGTEVSVTRFGREPFSGRRYEQTECPYCPDDFPEDHCPECVCRCESEGVISTERMLSYANSLASAAKSARVLARDLESVLSTFKSVD